MPVYKKENLTRCPFPHAFSGCDKTSTFFGKGKKLAWQAWQTCTDATEAMVHLADALFKNLDACW